MLSSPIGRLRAISLVEGVSFLVLLTCSVLKRTSDTDLVPIMGPIHGVLFILYVLATIDVSKRLAWPRGTTVLVALAAIPPLAPFYVERWLRKQETPAQV